MLNDITLLLCVDDTHIDELKFAWKTWKKFKPELCDLPKLVIYDEDIGSRITELEFLGNDFTLYRFSNKKYYSSQRHAMLTSFFEGIKQVSTKFYIKIDTDTMAVNHDTSWIRHLIDRDKYVFITNPWGYTKGPQRIINLENWGNNAVHLKQFPSLNIPIDLNSNIVSHPRIISWFFLGNTEWTNQMSSQCWNIDHFELPDPSQDTFMWYCADRRKESYKKIKFKKYGWTHTSIRKIKKYLELTYGKNWDIA